MPTFEVRSERRSLTGWRHFWAKRVKAFRPDVHCARCLVGSYVSAFNKTAAVNQPLQISGVGAGDVVYFCGVSDPVRWPRNLHLAAVVVDDADAFASVEAWTGDLLMVRGMLPLPFDDKIARRDHGFRDNSYLTCRNFQFGAHANAVGILPLDLGETAARLVG